MHRASLGVQFIYPVAEVLIDLTQYTNWNVTKVELVPVNTCQQRLLNTFHIFPTAKNCFQVQEDGMVGLIASVFVHIGVGLSTPRLRSI